MKLSDWKAILLAYRRVDDMLDAELPKGTQEPRARLAPDALELLARRLVSEVETLRAALGGERTAAEVDQALEPFTFLVDEKVLQRLEDADTHHWRPVQRRLFHVDSGGDLFFDKADAGLRRQDTPPLFFELLHFCLTAGFAGRHADHPARLRDYRERLAARIPRPRALPVAPEPPAGAMPPTVYDFPWRYYAVTAVVIVLLPVLLWRLSNT